MLTGRRLRPAQARIFLELIRRLHLLAITSITVTGTSSGVSHGTSAQLKIEDATIAISRLPATISVGNSTNVNVTLTSLNSSANQFTFSCLGAPLGMTCSFKPLTGAIDSEWHTDFRPNSTSNLAVPRVAWVFPPFAPRARETGFLKYMWPHSLCSYSCRLFGVRRGTDDWNSRGEG